jgi:hypothetical protein
LSRSSQRTLITHPARTSNNSVDEMAKSMMAAARPLTHASFVVMRGKVCVAYKNYKGIYKMIEKHERRFILESNSLPQATR